MPRGSARMDSIYRENSRKLRILLRLFREIFSAPGARTGAKTVLRSARHGFKVAIDLLTSLPSEFFC